MNPLVGLLDQRRVLLGISGGIAAYKTPELVRRMLDAGATVDAMLTDAGARFVSELSLEVVTGRPVGRHLWATGPQGNIVHTDAGKDADLIVLAPATADLLGKIAGGLADDLLTTTVMACRTPVLVCPSMNTEMLRNPLVQRNLDLLQSRETSGRYTFLEPGTGLLACGVHGPGRLPDPPDIIEAAALALTPKTLHGLRATVTAGPTREDLDPVRFLTNHSTGTMGFALARALTAAGADVTLIAGPVAGPHAHRTPVGVGRRVDVVSAADMAAAVDAAWPDSDLLVMAAAVADYRPATVSPQKIAKRPGALSLPLERTTDILASTAERAGRGDKIVVGFAAETHDVEARAAAKRTRKALDWIVANDVSGSAAGSGVGFGTGDNAGLLLGPDGARWVLERQPKDAMAVRIVDALTPSLRERFGVGA